MNFLAKTAETLACNFIPGYIWGKSIVMGTSQGTLKTTLLNTASHIGYHSFIAPAVGQALFSISPVRTAILGTGEYLGRHAGQATKSWVSRSIQTTVSQELENDQKATDEIKAKVQSIVMAAIGPTIEANNIPHMKYLTEQMTTRLIGACVQSQVAGQTTGRLLNMPTPPLSETAFFSLLINAINLYLIPQSSTSDDDVEKLKNDLQHQLLESITDPKRSLSPEFQNCLNSVFKKISETIVDHPTTDLVALKEALEKVVEKPSEPELPQLEPERPQKTIFGRIFATIADFFSAILQFLKGLLFRKQQESAVSQLKLL